MRNYKRRKYVSRRKRPTQNRSKNITLSKQIESGVWLDENEKITFNGNELTVKPFSYGRSLSVRIAKLKLK